MKLNRYGVAAATVIVLLGTSMAAGPHHSMRGDAIQPTFGPAAFDGRSYALLESSVFAEGCMGSNGQQHGCMCPLIAANEFSGDFLLTPNYHTPPGHTAYDIAIEEWTVVFGEDVYLISGDGYYDRWTDIDGESWQAMTLTLLIDGEDVVFTSGVLADDPAGTGFPQSISIALDNDADCYGYVIFIDAESQKLARRARIANRIGPAE